MVGYAIFTIYLGILYPGEYLYLFFANLAVVSIAVLGYQRYDDVFAKKEKKVSYKKNVHKNFVGKRTFTYNEEFIEINEKQYKWTEFSIVDTDDLYVYMYINECKKTVMFPKFPKDFPLEERDKLNQLIQEKFNVNIRL